MRKTKLFTVVFLASIYLGLPNWVIGQDVAQLAMRARVHLYETWNFDSAAYYFNQVIGEKNTPAFAYADYGWYLILLNKYDEGLNHIRQATEISSDDKQMVTWYAWAMIWGGDLTKAKLWIDKALTIDPDYGEALHVASRVASKLNNHKEAIELAERAAASDERWRAGIPLALALAGEQEPALAWTQKITKDEKVNDVIIMTEVYANLEKDDMALDYLEKSFELRHPYMPWMKFIPGTERLHNNSRFLNIVQKMNLPQ